MPSSPSPSPVSPGAGLLPERAARDEGLRVPRSPAGTGWRWEKAGVEKRRTVCLRLAGGGERCSHLLSQGEAAERAARDLGEESWCLRSSGGLSRQCPLQCTVVSTGLGAQLELHLLQSYLQVERERTSMALGSTTCSIFITGEVQLQK